MNATEVHWILEQARKVLRPGDYDELEAALRSSLRLGEADAGPLQPSIPVAGGPASETISEGESRFLHGDR